MLLASKILLRTEEGKDKGRNCTPVLTVRASVAPNVNSSLAPSP